MKHDRTKPSSPSPIHNTPKCTLGYYVMCIMYEHSMCVYSGVSYLSASSPHTPKSTRKQHLLHYTVNNLLKLSLTRSRIELTFVIIIANEDSQNEISKLRIIRKVSNLSCES